MNRLSATIAFPDVEEPAEFSTWLAALRILSTRRVPGMTLGICHKNSNFAVIVQEYLLLRRLDLSTSLVKSILREIEVIDKQVDGVAQREGRSLNTFLKMSLLLYKLINLNRSLSK